MADTLTSRSSNYARWYTDVIQRAELADYSPVKGCMVIRPSGYAIWENIQRILDERFKDTGHENAYFPLLIPSSFIEREAEHLEGFSPQLAVVTHAGGEQLPEPLVIRPTSETIIGTMYSQWIHSYRDLPVLINQWCNVLRWEKRTRLFLRTSEFLWQEGHTAHATEEEAEEEARKMLDVYADFAENIAAIPVIKGRKSAGEKFPGAAISYSIEGMMGDAKALQMGTSHNLGQNFAKTFNIQYLDKQDAKQHCWTTSWGVSTRLIGAVIMAHGDDHGLVLPPRLAPIQAVIIPIFKGESEQSEVSSAVERIVQSIGKAVRLRVDARDSHTAGWKFNEWELRGVPLRIEVGPRDVRNQQVVVARRDVPGPQGKTVVAESALPTALLAMLESIQASMLARARQFREAHTAEPATYNEFREAVQRGFALAYWCGTASCEESIKRETTATNRCIPLDEEAGQGASGVCVYCGHAAATRAVFARAY